MKSTKNKVSYSSLSEAKRLTKHVSTEMAKMVNDLTKLRNVTDKIKANLDIVSEEKVAEKMYDFYNEIARLEMELDEAHYYIKHMYEELGGTDVIPDPDMG